MRRRPGFWWFLAIVGIAVFCLLGVLVNLGRREEKAGKSGAKGQPEELVFNLEEVSVFEVVEQEDRFVAGQRGKCGQAPEAAVKAYPILKSEKPLYGSVRLETEYHFVLDESEGTGKGYDRLYFDLNRDLDLTNDAAVMPMQNPPKEALLRYTSIWRQVCFDYLYVDFDFGSEGKRPLEIMPRVLMLRSGGASIAFVATKARTGEAEIAGQGYSVLLGRTYQIGGWFQHPSTVLRLIAKDGEGRERTGRYVGADWLMVIRKIGERYYRFSSTPAGDRLIVRHYRGEFGRFEVGAGGRDVDKLEATGWLRSRDAAVVVGGELEDTRWPQACRSCELPVGDYMPEVLSITLGRLGIQVSRNFHSDGKPFDLCGRPLVYGIEIREDRPYAFEFSNKPEVVFAAPAKNCRLKQGEKLLIKAILTDPKLDVAITGLVDTTRKVVKEYQRSDGGTFTREKEFTLDPKVVIRRADGEKLAEGVTRFG